MPSTPTPGAAISELTAVPWKSSGRSVPVCGFRRMVFGRPANSAWYTSTPVSTTVTGLPGPGGVSFAARITPSHHCEPGRTVCSPRLDSTRTGRSASIRRARPRGDSAGSIRRAIAGDSAQTREIVLVDERCAGSAQRSGHSGIGRPLDVDEHTGRLVRGCARRREESRPRGRGGAQCWDEREPHDEQDDSAAEGRRFLTVAPGGGRRSPIDAARLTSRSSSSRSHAGGQGALVLERDRGRVLEGDPGRVEDRDLRGEVRPGF